MGRTYPQWTPRLCVRWPACKRFSLRYIAIAREDHLPSQIQTQTAHSHTTFFERLGLSRSRHRKPSSKYVSWIERWLLIYADHEMSTATFVFLITASAHADPLSCYLSAISTAYGMINGGAQDAAYRMLARVGSPENVPNLLAAVKRREEMLYGFGHRIYNTRDPRARMFLDILREVEEETGKKDPLLAVAEEVDRLASQDPFFQRRGIHINPDLYACFACTAMWVLNLRSSASSDTVRSGVYHRT